MEIKIRSIDRAVVKKLNESAADSGISREELLRNIIDSFIKEKTINKDPLANIIRENYMILEEIKYQLILINERILKSEKNKSDDS